MATNGTHHVISSLAELETLYPEAVYPPAKVKETDRVTKAYQALVEASPFCAMCLNSSDCACRQSTPSRPTPTCSMRWPTMPG